MATFYFAKRGDKLVPDTTEDVEILNRYKLKAKEGQRLRCDICAERSMKQHRFLWKLYRCALDNSESLSKIYRNEKELHVAMKHEYCRIKPEMYQTVKLLDGSVRKTVFSEAIDEMRQDEADEYINFVAETLSKAIGVDLTKFKAEAERGQV
jgi:hypothetical protein